ncbi:family 16 glycosylhydrolase [Bosea sp. NBC_00550]|uniref:family 16 glycosylhydrolase n=1 Tax=Bosea sp. NBC_00550 TaxID=2969621 RepID=UPI0022304AD8|nr:family 16 glycosylhydrolase [Bosea sp. NBC_00550]UZF91762.1 family 16 glycosylhydrolase [Bosea sp. NBC_00550]
MHERRSSSRNLALPRRGLLKGMAALAAAPLAVAGPASGTAAVPADPLAGRALSFSDDFAVLDTKLWQAGPKATTFDTGFYGRSAFARIDGEEGFNPYAIIDDPLTENGKALQISAKYIGRTMRVPAYYGNVLPEYQWISGNLQTARPDGTIVAGWRNGYFEARIRFPKHPLSFPAFWLMNGRSILLPKTSIEIDVVEHKGWELDLYGTYLHEWGQPGEHHEGVGMPTGTDITAGYFRYGVLVEGARCVPYFERRPVRDPKSGLPIDWTIGRARQLDDQGDVFWPLLTLALRSDVPFPDPLREEDRETSMRVDYFRVYA